MDKSRPWSEQRLVPQMPSIKRVIRHLGPRLSVAGPEDRGPGDRDTGVRGVGGGEVAEVHWDGDIPFSFFAALVLLFLVRAG
jgi:hypothetical protein